MVGASGVEPELRSFQQRALTTSARLPLVGILGIEPRFPLYQSGFLTVGRYAYLVDTVRIELTSLQCRCSILAIKLSAHNILVASPRFELGYLA